MKKTSAKKRENYPHGKIPTFTVWTRSMSETDLITDRMGANKYEDIYIIICRIWQFYDVLIVVYLSIFMLSALSRAINMDYIVWRQLTHLSSSHTLPSKIPQATCVP